jgi:hypothetical protein
MTTPSRRAFVSIAATIAITLALGACVHAPSRPVPELLSTDAGQLSIRFDNLGVERVDVYLIGGKREWLLGRVEPGAIASLRVPEGAFADGSKFVRLAVLANERVTFQAARNPRAKLTIALPPTAIVSQYWSFSQGELTSVEH